MKLSNYYFKTFLLCSILVSFLSASIAFADGYESPTPRGYDKTIVFMAKGAYDSPDGTFLLDGVIDGDGMAFQKEIMGRSDEEIEAHKQQATDFFTERFGIDLTDPDNYFTGYQLDPRNNFRAYTVSKERVPSSGWVVHDGGWQIIVFNPDGITLGGDFEGVHVPMFSAFVFGEYKIMTDKDPIVLHYQSVVPLIFTETGAMIRCEFSNDEFGSGAGGGFMHGMMMDDGLLHTTVREILTFPAHGEN